ncbi:MAG: hypothetical protein LBV03_09845 [Fusobacteriales bacterium]|nr:hypothetical protein [Fusobacteriales bacterium]
MKIENKTEITGYRLPDVLRVKCIFGKCRYFGIESHRLIWIFRFKKYTSFENLKEVSDKEKITAANNKDGVAQILEKLI